MTKLKLWLVPIVLFIVLVFVVAITTIWHYQGEKTHELEKSNQISYFISKNMTREIEYRLQALKVVSRQIRKVPGKAEFANMAKFLQTEYSGFFAINFVSTDGIIQIVYPEKENKAALGRNLLVERSDLKGYLLDAKRTSEPRVSHRILTYQMIYAVVLYVPLYDSANNFFGWLNGVLYIDYSLTDYMQGAKLDNVSARVRWHHPANTNELAYKWENPGEFQTTDYKIMNQTISIDVALGSTPLDKKRNQLYWMTIALRALLVLIITYLVSKLTLSKISLNDANQKLSFNNKMLTSLSHDVATPVTALYFDVQVAYEEKEISSNVAARFKEQLKTIEDMLKSIRMLHGYGLGAKSIPIENVPVLRALKSAFSIVELMAQNKKITFEVSNLIDDKLAVKANLHTLVNNVFINVLTNAIKFSNTEGKIKIDLTINGNQVELSFTDQGKGISAENIEKFNLTGSMTSQSGTLGEVGSGLGLMQISGFMKIYGGHVYIENVDHGTKVSLHFTKALI